MENVKEIAYKFFDEQEKLNVSFDSREAFIEGYKLAQAMDKEKLKDAYDAGVWDVGCRAVNFDEYYKRTFKSE